MSHELRTPLNATDGYAELLELGIHRGGQVSIECKTDGSSARIIVRDTGIGIAPDKLESIFEPFVQVDAGRSRSHEGVGLGLSIARNLARGMGGDLTVESTLGTGSSFALTLPRA